MAVTYAQVCRLALVLPGVREGDAYGGPSLHLGRKFMGRLWEDGETLVLKVDPRQRERLLLDSPDAFFLTDHYRDHPYVLINLLSADAEVLAPLIEAAWRMLASKRMIAARDTARAADGQRTEAKS
jgi:hypothetical protein